MKLDELINETDALTYINSLKCTLLEIKDEFSGIKEMAEYIKQATERTEKLMRKADNQYRLISKLVNREAAVASNLIVDDSIPEDFEELKKLMEE